jgi:hypothetical protein
VTQPDAAELARQALWQQQRESRVSRRIEVDSAFPGSNALAASVQAGFMPLIQFNFEQQLPPEEDVPDSPIVVNQNVW